MRDIDVGPTLVIAITIGAVIVLLGWAFLVYDPPPRPEEALLHCRKAVDVAAYERCLVESLKLGLE